MRFQTFINLKIVTIDRLKEFLNKFSKVAISGKHSDLSGVSTKVSQFTNDAGYIKTIDTPTFTAGQGIKIENGVISIINNKARSLPDISVKATLNWGRVVRYGNADIFLV